MYEQNLELEKTSKILTSMQCNFSLARAEEIFGRDSAHFWNKWLTSDSNLLNFLTRLDLINRERMYIWGKSL